MTITSDNLVGYLRAEFYKSGWLRVWLFFIQLAAAVPAAVSVVIPDTHPILLYGLAILSVMLILAWWFMDKFYSSAKTAGHAALRATLLLGGLDEELSPSEVESLRERFTVTSSRAQASEKQDYYATNAPPGAVRLGEMIEESALYSELLQRRSADVMFGVLVVFAAVVVVIALVSVPTVGRDTGMLVARIVLSLMVFGLSADLFGAWRLHQDAAEQIKQIRNRLKVADRAGYPMPDVLLSFVDYNSALEGAPESVPFIYGWYRNELEQRWKVYQDDRADARAHSMKLHPAGD
jgi:hypothetical protein